MRITIEKVLEAKIIIVRILRQYAKDRKPTDIGISRVYIDVIAEKAERIKKGMGQIVEWLAPETIRELN